MDKKEMNLFSLVEGIQEIDFDSKDCLEELFESVSEDPLVKKMAERQLKTKYSYPGGFISDITKRSVNIILSDKRTIDFQISIIKDKATKYKFGNRDEYSRKLDALENMRKEGASLIEYKKSNNQEKKEEEKYEDPSSRSISDDELDLQKLSSSTITTTIKRYRSFLYSKNLIDNPDDKKSYIDFDSDEQKNDDEFINNLKREQKIVIDKIKESEKNQDGEPFTPFSLDMFPTKDQYGEEAIYKLYTNILLYVAFILDKDPVVIHKTKSNIINKYLKDALKKNEDKIKELKKKKKDNILRDAVVLSKDDNSTSKYYDVLLSREFSKDKKKTILTDIISDYIVRASTNISNRYGISKSSISDIIAIGYLFAATNMDEFLELIKNPEYQDLSFTVYLTKVKGIYKAMVTGARDLAKVVSRNTTSEVWDANKYKREFKNYLYFQYGRNIKFDEKELAEKEQEFKEYLRANNKKDYDSFISTGIIRGDETISGGEDKDRTRFETLNVSDTEDYADKMTNDFNISLVKKYVNDFFEMIDEGIIIGKGKVIGVDKNSGYVKFGGGNIFSEKEIEMLKRIFGKVPNPNPNKDGEVDGIWHKFSDIANDVGVTGPTVNWFRKNLINKLQTIYNHCDEAIQSEKMKSYNNCGDAIQSSENIKSYNNMKKMVLYMGKVLGTITNTPKNKGNMAVSTSEAIKNMKKLFDIHNNHVELKLEDIQSFFYEK